MNKQSWNSKLSTFTSSIVASAMKERKANDTTESI